jgi:2-polyprenyl-6-methoxyphenol hydroxylase-like FAD-dependent oxidoreductase
VLILNHPGRAVVIHPTNGREGAGFFFRHPQMSETERRDVRLQKQLLSETYQSMGWRVPDLLHRVRDSDDLYFDSVSRISLTTWAQGRIVLVGDAADCISLFGEGSSMAIVGAATLAHALGDRATTTVEAVERYETSHRRQLQVHQRGASLASHLLIPRTRAGLLARNAVMRTVAISAATRQLLPRKGASTA